MPLCRYFSCDLDHSLSSRPKGEILPSTTCGVEISPFGRDDMSNLIEMSRIISAAEAIFILKIEDSKEAIPG
jgi:hypothetical protein